VLDDASVISQLKKLLDSSQNFVILLRVGFALLILIQPVLFSLFRQSSDMISVSFRKLLVRDEFDIMQVYDIKVVGVQTPKTARNTALYALRGIVESSGKAAGLGYLRPKSGLSDAKPLAHTSGRTNVYEARGKSCSRA
jgi:hypothetical protein